MSFRQSPSMLPTLPTTIHVEEAIPDSNFSLLTSTDEVAKASCLHSISEKARARALSMEIADGGPTSPKRRKSAPLETLFQEIPEPYIESQDYQRISISSVKNEETDRETKDVCKKLRRCLELREKWIRVNEPDVPDKITRSPSIIEGSLPQKGRRRQELLYNPFEAEVGPTTNEAFEKKNGVFHVHSVDKNGQVAKEPQYSVGTPQEFYADYFELKKIIHSGPVKTLAFKRLRLLEARFNLHTLLNSDREVIAQKAVPHRDFYNVRKVDTHVHHSACMNQKHLLRFIKSKLKENSDEIVIFRDGRFMTLREVFASLHLTAYDLSVDTLDMHASNTFHRFDRFNLKYNPAGQSRLREIFLKTDNLIAGRYLAEVTKEVMSDFKQSKYQLAEWRVSIYGKNHSEWDKLSRWFYVNRLSSPHVRWMIQIPRLYFLYKRSGEIENMQDMLDHIFAPLFEVTRDPSSNIPLHVFLQTIVGFDCVDDESKVEGVRAVEHRDLPTPENWTMDENPPYDYWSYYLYANLATLNEYRRSKNLNTFTFRPHSGEAGDSDHLAASFLTANAINHGITLRKSVALQYLYYLSQIGIALSPLSNNKLFLEYHRNPFPMYFAIGLNVSLSSDDPLLLHFTKDALVEEYSVAAQVWKLSSTDVCEIARNSVLQSGFEHAFKAHYLGENYHLRGAAGNDIRMSNVPDIRVNYRQDTLDEELAFIKQD